MQRWVFQPLTSTTPVRKVPTPHWCVTREVPPYTPTIRCGASGFSRPTKNSTAPSNTAHGTLLPLSTPRCLRGSTLEPRRRTSGFSWSTWLALIRGATAAPPWRLKTSIMKLCREPTATCFLKLYQVRALQLQHSIVGLLSTAMITIN